MKEINFEFDVPSYIFEEIIEYVELSSKGKNCYMKWENIRILLNLAVVNKRLTTIQAKYIEEKYCREKD